ncbi:unnamed protein product [Rotaria socialis]|uniref:Transposase n=1 Tax=Rotaria socialis TaxID=392032 RepID=A0A819Z1S7_9BILA|nr:unnamed protein product [Rotaria socialis]CAF4389323.1 unnamed protein product [Rotaria socialis]
MTARKISMEPDISKRSVRRIMKNDLGLYPYKKKVIEPLLSDHQKLKRKQFANWVRTNFRKEDTLKILFSDEKMLDIDGVYDTQNDRVWTVDRAGADKNGGIQQRRKFPQKVIIWLGSAGQQHQLEQSLLKKTPNQELKWSVKKVSEPVVFESCAYWINRLYRLYQNDGNYLC